MKLIVLGIFFLTFFLPKETLAQSSERSDSADQFVQTDLESALQFSDSHVSEPGSKEGRLTGYFDTFWVGPRINYIQGKYGFLGCSAAFMWHNIGYLPESHIGFSPGMDFRLTKSTVYAPKITFEARYIFFLARVGYSYLTDFKSDFEHRISTEIGLSLLSFLDITYLYSFGSVRNPFGLNNHYLNVTVTIPVNW